MKKVDEYVEQPVVEQKTKTGLLARSPMTKEISATMKEKANPRDMVAQRVASFVSDIRKKRMEIQNDSE